MHTSPKDEKLELAPRGLCTYIKSHQAAHAVRQALATLALGKWIALDTRISCPWEHDSFKSFRDSSGKTVELWGLGPAPGMLWFSIPQIKISPNAKINIWERILVILKLYFALKYYLSLLLKETLALEQPKMRGEAAPKGGNLEKDTHTVK